jgi:hypothetical protein
VSAGLPARLLASVIHAVASEYRKLDAPPPAEPAAAPVRQEISCTSASTQQAWQQAQRPPAPARAFGFGKQAGRG